MCILKKKTVIAEGKLLSEWDMNNTIFDHFSLNLFWLICIDLDFSSMHVEIIMGFITPLSVTSLTDNSRLTSSWVTTTCSSYQNISASSWFLLYCMLLFCIVLFLWRIKQAHLLLLSDLIYSVNLNWGEWYEIYSIGPWFCSWGFLDQIIHVIRRHVVS